MFKDVGNKESTLFHLFAIELVFEPRIEKGEMVHMSHQAEKGETFTTF